MYGNTMVACWQRLACNVIVTSVFQSHLSGCMQAGWVLDHRCHCGAKSSTVSSGSCGWRTYAQQTNSTSKRSTETCTCICCTYLRFHCTDTEIIISWHRCCMFLLQHAIPPHPSSELNWKTSSHERSKQLDNDVTHWSFSCHSYG